MKKGLSSCIVKFAKQTLKEKVWNEHMEPWFNGPDDPNLVILKVIPNSIRLMNVKGEDPKVITP